MRKLSLIRLFPILETIGLNFEFLHGEPSLPVLPVCSSADFGFQSLRSRKSLILLLSLCLKHSNLPRFLSNLNLRSLCRLFDMLHPNKPHLSIGRIIPPIIAFPPPGLSLNNPILNEQNPNKTHPPYLTIPFSFLTTSSRSIYGRIQVHDSSSPMD